MTPSRNISRLIEIMAALRDPQTGCPWDLVQDFASIRHHTIEEAYEVADAIERQDFEDLRDELGDLLLQPVYHAQMAAELGLFDIGDVIYAITEKLIQRHPHVFGAQPADGADEAKLRWEDIKAKERSQKAARIQASGGASAPLSILDNIALPLPALARAQKLDKRAAANGFDWPDINAALDKCKEEIAEVSDVLAQNSRSKTEEEIGDLLFAVSSMARHAGVDAEAALCDANLKFTRRFKYVEKRCREDGVVLAKASLETLDGYWNEIRALDKQETS